jgi:hypothetical protein
MPEAARLLLMYGVVPLWIVAGLLDWWCHRRTRIESTSGLKENLFHWVLFGQAGLALAAAALLEANAAVLLLVAAAFLAHELTTYVELRYTVPRRPVLPFEQMVHSFMELLPLVLLVLLAVIAWDGAGGGRGLVPALAFKAQPWPAGYLLAVVAAAGLFNVLPLAEECRRCLRSRTPRRPAPT